MSHGERTFPERVGPYRLLREVGQGGMGRVFLAEQETPDFRRTVALKLIDRAELDDEAVRRFRDEVRILASLDHPGIVRFLDGGRSGEGVWFLALEYVEGDDLLAHARRFDLDIPSRVELIAAVAEAVAFAHARGVVHRDLKPANVLVGLDGRPRLLDFGISKLLDGTGAGAGAFTTTRHGLAPLTPAYASPEQLEGRSATAASDGYSLGVMLYELLAGARPITTASAPEPPSAAARRAPAGKSTGSGRGARRISRELDAVCLKAPRREPAARYPSAVELAADLRRLLAGEPVAARPDGFGDRARRAWLGELERLGWRRRSAALLAGAAALVLAGAAMTVWLRDRGASSATATPPSAFPLDTDELPPIAESEALWAKEPGNVVAGVKTAMALAGEKRLEEAGFAIRKLRQTPGRELDPLIDYAEAAIAIESGELQRALVLYTRALEGALAHRRGDLVGGIRLARGATLMRLGQRDAARTELLAASAELEVAGDHELLHRARNILALEHMRRGEMSQSATAFEQALAAARAAGSPALLTRTNFAMLDLLRGRPDLAEPKLVEVVAARRASGSVLREGQSLLVLALAVRDLGRPEEADDLLARSLELLRRSDSPVSLAAAIHELALARLDGGRLEPVAGLAEELESISKEILHRRTLAFARSARARLAALRGEPAAARADFTEARRLLLSNGDRETAATSDLAWATMEWRAGDAAAASRILDQALGEIEHPEATLPGFFAAILRARLDLEAGRRDAARQRLAALEADAAPSPSVSRRLAFLTARGALAAADGKTAEAKSDLESALDLARRSGRKVDELELRLELASLDPPGPAPGSGRATPPEIEREARTLGLHELAGRAARLVASTPARAL